MDDPSRVATLLIIAAVGFYIYLVYKLTPVIHSLVIALQS